MPGCEASAAFRWSPIRFGDTDPYGVVYFVSYFRYMKEALDEFLRAAGSPRSGPIATLRSAVACPS